ncbi:MAG TPA: HD-GYP domain-containing protein, partial [Campylobacterales bacterium]|nr:HD-GYP domain-containing protein [Campylobacterales bacterium]
FAKASDDEKYKLIIVSEKDAFLYFQTKLQVGKKSYYINILVKLDDNTILMVKNNVYISLVVIFLTIAIVVASIFPIIYSQYKSVLEKKNELALSHLNTLKSLGAAIAKRDSDTSEHNYRVTYYSVKIAEAMGCDKKFIVSLIKGAFLHDVGKIAITDAILLKPSRLSEKEFEIMKTHVLHGVDIVDDIAWIKEAKNVIAYHHERVDGGGYPRGVKGEDIPMQAKIFTVADVFDALTSKRPYKEAFEAQRSFELIKDDADKHFDGRVVLIFEKIYLSLYKEMQNKNPKELESVFQLMLQGYF